MLLASVLQALASQPIEQAKARRLRPAGLCSERNLTPFVSGFSGGRVKQHPIANPNRHGGVRGSVRWAVPFNKRLSLSPSQS